MRTTRPWISFGRGAFAGLHRRHERALDRQSGERRGGTRGHRRNERAERRRGRWQPRAARPASLSIGGSGGGGGHTCGLQKFDVERKPAEILLLLDRSKSMIEDTTSDGVTLKWNAVLPALKQVIMDTDAAVSWGLKTFPEGDGSECVAGSVTNNVVVPSRR